MFEKARQLVLSDRTAARKALADEIRKNERDDIDAELDALEADERERQAAEEAEALRAQRAAQAREELDAIKARQHAAALSYDASLAAANDAFQQLELLSSETARLERELGVGDGRRPVIAGHARSGALVAAAWQSARPLAKRLGLRAVPGSARNIRPLATVYPKSEKEDK